MSDKVRASTSPFPRQRPQLPPPPNGREPVKAMRRYPVGAEILPGRGTHFRVWAPGRRKVEVVLEGQGGRAFELAAEDGGYFAGITEAGDGTRYRFRLDGEEALCPDPASRFQPDGPHGPSQVVD